MKKKLLSLTLAALLAVSLCGCTGTPFSTTGSATAPDTTPALTTPQPTTPADTAPDYTVPEEAVDVYEAFSSATYIAEDGTELPYRLFSPENYREDREYPILLILHGAGERGTDNSLQLKNAVQNLFNDTTSPVYGAFVVCPQCPEAPNQWVDTPWADGNYSLNEVPQSNELAAVEELLLQLMEDLPVDNARVYVMGLSMGGFGTWDLLMRNPTLYTAAVPLCGGADPAYAEVLVNTPIYTVHSTDDGAVPCAGTREMVAAIKAAGGEKIIYEELEGYGHNVWDYASQKPEIIRWLFDQTY